ncbi:MAG: hypothetical protein COV29_00740 [Candidatus Yanofskybacteria bacterium CG10_big_fil_rev_8_21_14_0_10_36_16]|uniref:histidine kinase n=1 Tax=Candidatus Yanofskybacteria bacterium CG10_big_fil_rev_8_21_14_0_10_36_16 TaxID=1975096 RepID=A0A2J0Q7Z7_9BACT|nr:MAG: hypothetical protein COV29_00740 [Candidatus Yanofskybacteria bacterium CG10_big_fil_rev_8_21_14_0_10_36_16]
MEKITQVWKQLEESVIDLGNKIKDDVFFRARLKFSFLYAVAILVGLTVFVITLNYFRVADLSLKSNIDNYADFSVGELVMTRTISDLESGNFLLHLSVVAGSLVGGYFFSSGFLKPIRESTEVQKRFVADASHELRTPLSVMRTNSELALMNIEELDLFCKKAPKNIKSEVGELKDSIKSNIQEIDRSARIIKNLLNLSHLDNKSYEMSFTRVDLHDVVVEAVKQLEDFAKKKKIKLVIVKDGHARVWGNQTALEEMAFNLIKNSIKYTSLKGRVEIKIEDLKNKVRLSVIDTGMGMTQGDIKHIFDPFYKAKTSGNYRDVSPGLGLAIVREIIKKHNGTINVKSILNRGSVFSVNLKTSSVYS